MICWIYYKWLVWFVINCPCGLPLLLRLDDDDAPSGWTLGWPSGNQGSYFFGFLFNSLSPVSIAWELGLSQLLCRYGSNAVGWIFSSVMTPRPTGDVLAPGALSCSSSVCSAAGFICNFCVFYHNFGSILVFILLWVV